MPRWLWITLVIAVLGLFWAAGREPPVESVSGPGASLACPQMPSPAGLPAPLQIRVNDAPAVRLGHHTIRPLAAFALEARVLGREDYRFDRGAALSPTDLALGWQRMSDQAVYERLDISQGGRWYRYRWGAEGPPIPVHEIVSSSANMHLVPASETVADAIDKARQDQTVRLTGWLVEISDGDGWQWRSSLSRDDSGDGACELIYVCEFESF